MTLQSARLRRFGSALANGENMNARRIRPFHRGGQYTPGAESLSGLSSMTRNSTGSGVGYRSRQWSRPVLATAAE